MRFAPIPKINRVLSFPPLKDSTYMLLDAVKRNVRLHSIIFFDTGWEFPEMIDHVNQVEKDIGREIIRTHPPETFERLLLHRPIRAVKGPNKGEIYRYGYGYGWPGMRLRWCTRVKVDTLTNYTRQISNVEQMIGYSKGEESRAEGISINSSRIRSTFPLIEQGITGPGALA